MPGRIPCSVNMLTRNSARTLDAALASVSDFAQIVIADGASTDETRTIAARYGCQVVDQDPRYTDASGRLLDYAGARSQLIGISSHDWVLYLDSDEILTPEGASAIADVLSDDVPEEVGAFRLRARYVVNGMMIEDGAKAGLHLPRLVRRSGLAGFVGRFDEYVELLPGYVIQDLEARFLIPLAPVRRLIPKWAHYVRVYGREALDKGPEWTDQQLPERRSAIRWLIRDWLAARRRRRPGRMPFRYELGHLVLASLVYMTLRIVRIRQGLQRDRPA